MPGGLLNLISYGSENIILNGNPSKTFFKSVYNKYTNFGMQTFRMDHIGTNSVQENSKSVFKFKIKRYGDLLYDTYFSISLPDIFGSGTLNNDFNVYKKYSKYNFKWIENIGYNLIDEVSIYIGGQLINKYSGEYLLLLQELFQSEDKASNINKMTGNIPQLFNPEINIKKYYNYKFGNNNDYYPNSYNNRQNNNNTFNEPSIYGKKLYIPISAWFGNSTKQALPLVSLQYSEVEINVTLKAISDLYLIQNATITKKK